MIIAMIIAVTGPFGNSHHANHDYAADMASFLAFNALSWWVLLHRRPSACSAWFCGWDGLTAYARIECSSGSSGMTAPCRKSLFAVSTAGRWCQHHNDRCHHASCKAHEVNRPNLRCWRADLSQSFPYTGLSKPFMVAMIQTAMMERRVTGFAYDANQRLVEGSRQLFWIAGHPEALRFHLAPRSRALTLVSPGFWSANRLLPYLRVLLE
jgi:hypothetical protein